MTPLGDIIRQRIAATGPISIADYMTECLLHPRYGYYTTRDPLGAAGDFTTAPEISQMFGELVGLALAQCWQDQGAPGAFTLAEPGPGRGTLMADILRATRGVPGFHAAANLHLIEASPALRRIQQETLADHDPVWIDDIGALPEAPMFLVANEFFDALPIRQFQRDGQHWRERMVGLRDGQLAFGQDAAAPHAGLAPRLADTKPGDIVEINAPARAIAETIANRIARHGGAALIIDYGDWRSQGDTLQALCNHAFEHPLAHPGQADLTAHVDFEALAQAAGNVSHTRLTSQGAFLERLGITARAQALAARLSGTALQSHIAAHRRLTHPAEMGSLFKVIGLHRIGTAPPPGLEP